VMSLPGSFVHHFSPWLARKTWRLYFKISALLKGPNLTGRLNLH
jgi:hypothetical protein